MTDKLENFERAFDSGSGGCRRTCHCGKEFYDDENSYSWDEGEKEKLKADGATALSYSVGTIKFEGKEYVADCNCWKERAQRLIGFIDGHAHSIARYLSLEKQRKQSIADNAPVVVES